MPYILQTNHLTKTISGKDLVNDVSLHIKKGEIYGFLGPNGASCQFGCTSPLSDRPK